jgi:hypothetical protein
MASMVTKQRTKSKNRRMEQTVPAAGRFLIVLSATVHTALNMAFVVVTTGSVLLFLLAAKRFL